MREQVARFLGQVGRGLWLFSGASLRGADLRRARLDALTLAGADLRRARLQGASLRGARLDGASLAGADLRDADMRGADLRDADMRGARLDGINVRGAWVDSEALALLDDAPDAHATGVIVSVHRSTAGEADELADTGADRETETETERRLDDMAALTEEMREHIQTLKGLKHTGAFSERAYGRLYRAILAGEDAYAYASLDGRLYAWHAGRRYTASAYNALAYADEVGRAFPIVLWRLMTPGFSYPDGRTWETFTDADGREWETFSESERVTCALCGAGITHGYRTPDTVNEPARPVCVAHVAAHLGEDIASDGEPIGE